MAISNRKVTVSTTAQSWNSITATVSASWGPQPSGYSYKRKELIVYSSNIDSRGAWVKINTNDSDSITASGTPNWNSGSYPTIKGAGTYKLTSWTAWSNQTNVNSTDGQTDENWGDNTVTVATAPSPLTSLTLVSQTPQETANAVTAKISITGGNSTNNNNNDVIFYYCYRYSTDGGTTWTNKPDGYWPAHGWISAGTGKPWDTKQATFDIPYGAKVEVKALQQYNNGSQGSNSTTKDLSFTSTQSTMPTGTVEVLATTPHSITIKSTVTDWGHPSNFEHRNVPRVKLSETAAASLESDSEGVYTLTNQDKTATHGSSEAAIRLYGGLTVYPDAWFSNGVGNGTVKAPTYPVTLPDIPNYVSDNGKSKKVKIAYIGTSEGKSKAIKKIYVSKNGKATLVY